ncbi:hypothetical protein Tco_1538954 [Tanacetum coccineum]
MAAGSRDRPPMLATRRYAQWQSRFLRYIDTRPNGDALRKYILEGPYKLTTVIILVVPAIDDTPAVPERTTVKTLLTMSLKNKAHYGLEKEAIHLLLTVLSQKLNPFHNISYTNKQKARKIERKVGRFIREKLERWMITHTHTSE